VRHAEEAGRTRRCSRTLRRCRTHPHRSRGAPAPAPPPGAPDRADVGGAHDRTEVSAATRRIVSQLELARRDARARTLRATTLPISIGVFLSVCSIGVWTRGTAPGASGWLDPAAAALGALGWSGFLSGLDPTSDVMPLVGALVLLGFNSFSALALVGAVLAVLASVPAECSALGDALVADGILASACIIFTAGVVAPAACLASWRAATSDGAAQRARCVGGLPPITTRRLVDVVWICSGCTYAGLSAGVLYAAAVKLAFGLPGVLPELLSMAVSVTTALLWWSTAVRVRVHALLISGGEHVATAAGARARRARARAAAREHRGRRPTRVARSHGVCAGITTLLGGVDATTVQTSIATARERFRAIPFRALDESALAQAAPAGRHANYWCARARERAGARVRAQQSSPPSLPRCAGTIGPCRRASASASMARPSPSPARLAPRATARASRRARPRGPRARALLATALRMTARTSRARRSRDRARAASRSAFISHSWWDPAPSKWAALRTWAAGFEREHDRQPMVWVVRARPRTERAPLRRVLCTHVPVRVPVPRAPAVAHRTARASTR
jgi:hypothetical protein